MIYLIRHAQSEANLKRIWGGNYPLTDKGIRDTQNLRKRLTIMPDIIVSSPLIRAQQTAKLLFPNKNIITDDVFKEINFGNHENEVMSEDECLKIYQTKPSVLHEFSQGDIIKERADKAIISLFDYLPMGTIAVVCHDTLIRAIICRLKGEDLDNMPSYKSLLPNCGIVGIEFPTKICIM